MSRHDLAEFKVRTGGPRSPMGPRRPWPRAWRSGSGCRCIRVASSGPCTAQPLVTSSLDVDGNGTVDALADSLSLIRHFFGFRGTTLVTGAVASNCKCCTAAEIEAYVDRVKNSVQIDQIIP